MSNGYLHGYDTDEQRRLIAQAEYWRDKVIVPGLGYRAGETLLDIGCGVGAVLGVIASAYPGLKLAGIDLSPKQIETARRHLASLGNADVDLRVGDASRLPWADASVDHVFTMWFLEHLGDPMPVLREARRVLKPGGTITCIETDYSSFKVWPQNKDWDLIERAQFEHFRRHGQASAGPSLDDWLARAGFDRIENTRHVFQFTTARAREALKAHAEYLAGFLAPAVQGLTILGPDYDANAMMRGVSHLLNVHFHPQGMAMNLVYRCRAVRA